MTKDSRNLSERYVEMESSRFKYDLSLLTYFKSYIEKRE